VFEFEDISAEQRLRTYDTSFVCCIGTHRPSLDDVGEGSSIINTGSINGLRGNKRLIDYAATKGAVHVLTYSLAQTLEPRGIRVNCVAPGPVWTPLIPATMEEEKVESFGEQAPMGRAAHPDEIAPSYVFFAAGELSSYYSGQVLAPIGGETLPGG
jgi:NAD(P)-dependent dehydrogenase (short-subunit alcohol dehydrogenase family)